MKYMKVLAPLFMLWLFFAPVMAQSPSHYLAIYCSKDRIHRYGKDIFNHPIDLIVSAKDWRSFDPFLKKVKEEAHGRPIIINLMAHGTDVVPVLLVGDDKHSYAATEGAVLNHIEEIIGDDLVLVQETCFGSSVYKGSLNPYRELIRKGDKTLLENRTKGNPKFKVLGIDGYSNPIPCALEQYLHNDMETLVDLREFTTKAPARLNEKEQKARTDVNYLLLMLNHMRDGINQL
jgi:hypothetical protein